MRRIYVLSAVIALLAVIVVLVVSHTPTERLTCEVMDLEEYGFIQVSEFDEYVCKNPDDKADFVVIVDENEEYNIGDMLIVKLNEHGEVISVK